MQLLKTLLLAAAFCGCLSLSCQAQSRPDTLKNEIGFGTDILLKGLFSSHAAPFDLLYRRQSEQGYWRLGFSVLASVNKNFQETYQHYNSYIRPEVIVGKEWREMVHERWVVNYGGDIKGTYFRSSGKTIYEYPARDGREAVELRQTYGLGARPFLGVMFKVSDRLYLNTEASVLTKVERLLVSSGEYELIDGERGVYKGDADRSGWHFDFRTISASNVFIYYRF